MMQPSWWNRYKGHPDSIAFIFDLATSAEQWEQTSTSSFQSWHTAITSMSTTSCESCPWWQNPAIPEFLKSLSFTQDVFLSPAPATFARKIRLACETISGIGGSLRHSKTIAFKLSCPYYFVFCFYQNDPEESHAYSDQRLEIKHLWSYICCNWPKLGVVKNSNSNGHVVHGCSQQ